MHKLKILTACCLVTGCTANESPLAGSYSCTVTQTATFSEPSNAEPSTQQWTATALITDAGESKLSVEFMTTGSSVTCPSLTFSAADTTASLDAGQSCTFATSNGTLNIVWTSGQLTLNGRMLVGSFTGSVSGNLLMGGEVIPVLGMVVQSRNCSRT